jgi:SP family sugar:H+ symporter-like MFS transporter
LVGEFTVTVSFLPLLKAIGLTGAYASYAIAAAISLPFVWLAVCETKGKTLEQMKDIMEPRTANRTLKS